MIDQTVVDVVSATEQLAGYATPAKQQALQTCVNALSAVVDGQIRAVLEGRSLDLDPSEVIGIMNPLLAASSKLALRPIAYPSALICLSTAHSLVRRGDGVRDATVLTATC